MTNPGRPILANTPASMTFLSHSYIPSGWIPLPSSLGGRPPPSRCRAPPLSRQLGPRITNIDALSNSLSGAQRSVSSPVKNSSHPLLVIGAVHLKCRTPALCFSGCRSTKNIRPLRSAKVSGVTIVSSVHCLSHDINIHLLTFQFDRFYYWGTSSYPTRAPLCTAVSPSPA